MKRLEKEDLIITINGLKEFRTFLFAIIVCLVFLACFLRGEFVRLKAEYEQAINNHKQEMDILLDENISLKKELDFFKEENLQLYKDYKNHCQLYHQDSMINPVDMRLVFIDGDVCYYDRYHNNALYYMDENGILIPLYNEDGSIKIFEYPR